MYAFCILANNVPSATTLTNLTFTLDGAQVGTFVHVPTSSPDYQYNFPVYANASIPGGRHLFTISIAGDTNSSVVVFDYLMYS